jgi:hypothetical protein
MADLQALAELYQRVVQDTLGFEADIDEDMDVVFDEPELGTLFFSIDEDDPEYMRLVFGGFTSAEDLGVTDAELLAVLDEVNGNCKAAKIYVETGEDYEDEDEEEKDEDGPAVKGMVTISVEAFVAAADQLPDEALLRAIAPRSLAAARSAAMELLNVVSKRYP